LEGFPLVNNNVRPITSEKQKNIISILVKYTARMEIEAMVQPLAKSWWLQV